LTCQKPRQFIQFSYDAATYSGRILQPARWSCTHQALMTLSSRRGGRLLAYLADYRPSDSRPNLNISRPPRHCVTCIRPARTEKGGAISGIELSAYTHGSETNLGIARVVMGSTYPRGLIWHRRIWAMKTKNGDKSSNVAELTVEEHDAHALPNRWQRECICRRT